MAAYNQADFQELMKNLYKKPQCKVGLIMSFLLIISSIVTPVFSQKNNDAHKYVHLCHDTIIKIGINGRGDVKDIPEPGTVGNPGTRIDPYPKLSDANNRGCLLMGETFSNWFLIPIGQDGSLEFIIGSDSTQIGFYDWILYPYDGKSITEEKIANNEVAPIRCNWNGAEYGGTGLLYKKDVPLDAHISNFETPFQAQEGEHYLLCINNNDAVQADVKIKFTGTAVIGFYNPPLVDIFGDSVICHNETAVLEAKRGGMTSDFVWSTGATTNSIEVTPEENQNYSVSVTTQYCGKIKGFDNFNIEVLPQPEIDYEIFPDQDEYDIATNMSFTDKSTTENGTMSEWIWIFGDGTFTNNQNAYHTYNDTGKFTIIFIATNSEGCKDTMYNEIMVNPILELFKPTAFTPNGDGINDVFYISNFGITEFKMTIYNRWGKEIHYTRNINEFWNGRKFNHGKLVPFGSYVYDIYYKDYSGFERNEQGVISIIR
ncbi:MAG: gliding motility-associated C-terminal domain-containing protein [Bacteroidia bacterium]|nr:gliding motility-associated C-terminal domain-containing protein [Bacteroidia bacterium]